MRILDNPNFTLLAHSFPFLFGAADSASFFDTAQWYDLVSRFGLPPGSIARLILDDKETAAFVLRMQPSAPTEFYSCVNVYACEHAVLSAPHARGAIESLVCEIACSNPRIHRIQLSGLLRENNAFSATLNGLRQAGFVTRPFFGWGNWYEPVKATFDDYLAARPSILLSTWKRKQSALRKSAHSSLHLYDASQEIERYIGAYSQVQAQSWKGIEPFPHFLPELIRTLAIMNALRMGILEIDGKPAAVQFWILWRGKALLFKLVHAEQFQTFSPGTLLTMSMIRHIMENDSPTEFDFGRGDDEYKKLWFSLRRERWGIDAANPRTVRGGLLAAHMGIGALRQKFLSRMTISALRE